MELLTKCCGDEVIIKQCKVRAFNMKQRFSIDFPAVGIAREFVRKVNCLEYVAKDPADRAGQHPTLRATPDRSKEDRERITYMTKAWKVVHETLKDNAGWTEGMSLRSTGTDGVLFVENAEKNDGFRVVRMTFDTALLPVMDMNVDVLSSLFGA
eukprot:161859-Heterocapsa_arctica.AAC.1